MRDLLDLVKVLDRIAARGPNKILLRKMQASGVSIADAFTLGHSAALLEVISWLKDAKKERKS